MDPFALLFEQMFQGLAADPSMFAGMMASTGMPPPNPGEAFGGAPLGAYAAGTQMQGAQFPQGGVQATAPLQAPPSDPIAGFADAQLGMHGTGELPGAPMNERAFTSSMSSKAPTQVQPGNPSAQVQPQTQAAPQVQDFSKGRTGRPLDPAKVDRIVTHDISGNPQTRKLPHPQNTKEYHLSFDDKGVYQHLPLNVRAPHARKFNDSSIGIAYRGFEGDKLSPAAIANSRIARDIALKQYPNIKPENIGTHPSLGREGTLAYPKDAREGAWVTEMMADRTGPANTQGTAIAQAQAQPQKQVQPQATPQPTQAQPQLQEGPTQVVGGGVSPIGQLAMGPQAGQMNLGGQGITGGEGLDSIMKRLPPMDKPPVQDPVVPSTAGKEQAEITGDMGGGPAPAPVEVAKATPQPQLGVGAAAAGVEPGAEPVATGISRNPMVPTAMNPLSMAAKALTGGSSDQRPIMTAGVAGAQKAPELQKASKGVTSVTMDTIMQLLGGRRQNPLIAPTLGSLLRG